MSGSNICNSTSRDLKEINDLNNTLMSLSVLIDGCLNLNLHNGKQKNIHYFFAPIDCCKGKFNGSTC